MISPHSLHSIPSENPGSVQDGEIPAEITYVCVFFWMIVFFMYPQTLQTCSEEPSSAQVDSLIVSEEPNV